MSVYARADVEITCDKCGDGQNEDDSMYCGKCAGIVAPKPFEAIVAKVRWIGDELRDTKADWRIVERVRELEAELTA